MSFLIYLALPFIKNIVKSKSKKNLPVTDGEITIKGIEEDVEIYRDKWGVPHIFAQNMKDALFAQGYVHAQDRLWQMEFNRRLASGTLAEILGQEALDTDRINRTLGFRRNAVKDIEKVKPAMYDELASYVRGVNHYLETKKNHLPPEFRLLGIKPKLWEPIDMAAVSRFYNFNMSFAWQSKLVSKLIVDKVGAEKAQELRIRYPEGNPETFGKEFEVNRFLSDGRLKAFEGPFLKPIKGSNAWSVSKLKSRNGNAYLCNDPHLPILFPAFWYENHVEGGKLKISGVSIPGMPLIKIGHNKNIAWGMTLSYIDVQDLYIEKFVDEKAGTYEYDGEILQAEVITEEIKVKRKGKPHIEKILVTRHGPVISEMLGETKYKMTLCSVPLQDKNYIDGWYGLSMAKDWNTFVSAVEKLEMPSLNILYADRKGNCGHWVSGKVPVRSNRKNTLPLEGWTGKNEWTGFIPFEEMPHSFNPEKGYNISCNHKLVDDSYPHYLGDYWMNGYRAKRLEELMKSREKLDKQDFIKMQMDQHCEPGYQLAQMYKGLTSVNLRTMEIKNILTKWDGELGEKSVAGSIYEVVKQMLIKNIIEKELGNELTQQWKGTGVKPPVFMYSEFMGHDFAALVDILNNPDSWWLQQSGGREEVLIKSLEDAIVWLTEKMGEDQSEWLWGKLHAMIFPHVIGQKKPLDTIFNLGPLEIGGDTDTLFQTAHVPWHHYGGETGAPVYRQIIDMSNFDNSVNILTPGQSGNLLSDHHNDQIEMWKEGKYKKMLWSKNLIEDQSNVKLILRKAAAEIKS